MVRHLPARLRRLDREPERADRRLLPDDLVEAGRTNGGRWIFRGWRRKWPDRATSVVTGSVTSCGGSIGCPASNFTTIRFGSGDRRCLWRAIQTASTVAATLVEVDRWRRTRRLGGRKWPDRATCRTDLERGLAGGRDITRRIGELLAVLVPEDERVRRLALDRQEVAVDEARGNRGKPS